MRSVAHAIAQRELEGLKVPASTVADLPGAARGEIDTDEVIRNIYSGSGMSRYSGNDLTLIRRPAS
jgi:hypothetical protein